MKSACSYLRIQVTVQTAANGEEKNNSEDSSDSAVLKIFANTNELAFLAPSEAWRGDVAHAQVQNFSLGLAMGHPPPLK